jgi:phenylalanine-4-hydroxylase
VEYGLIGTLDNPKIYGAGLLSSIGESGVWRMKYKNFLIPLMLPMPFWHNKTATSTLRYT